MKLPSGRFVGYPASAVVVLATIGLLKLFPQLTETSAALLLLLSIFLCASVWQSGPGVFAAVLATLGFNFFFIPPIYTFTVEDPRNVAALVVFLASGLLIGRLSALARQRLALLEAERRDLVALTELSHGFLADTNRESLLGVAVDRLRQALRSDEVAIFLATPQGELAQAAATTPADVRTDLLELAFRQGNSASFPSTLGGTDIYLPIPVGVQRVGALAARGMRSGERLAEACTALLGLALERERFVQMAREAESTKASDEMKSTLLAALAHDLKTPVAAARGAVENWASQDVSADSARLPLEAMERLTRRINDLMDVVRLDAGVARPRRERVTASEIVEAAVARFSDALATHSLFLDVPPSEIPLEVDPAQLTEALGHGLENAARYSPAGSEVRVSVEEDGDQVRFQVVDRGTGVPAAEQERVFERFVRLPATEAIPGTGLGLFIARRLVEINGGQVRIAAVEPGGTRFEILLPRAAG